MLGRKVRASHPPTRGTAFSLGISQHLNHLIPAEYNIAYGHMSLPLNLLILAEYNIAYGHMSLPLNLLMLVTGSLGRCQVMQHTYMFYQGVSYHFILSF